MYAQSHNAKKFVPLSMIKSVQDIRVIVYLRTTSLDVGAMMKTIHTLTVEFHKRAAQRNAMEYASISMVKKNVSATMVEHLQSATLLMDLVQG